MENKDQVLPVPPMSVIVNDMSSPETSITDGDLHEIYSEILGDLRNDRKEIDSLLNNFVEMVMNEGDSSSSSKEAVVNLIKVKSDIADKKTKIADLMTTLRLKDKSVSKVTANQTNHIHITDKRNLLETLNNIKKVKDESKLDNSKRLVD
jgi:ABC-type transporter Mla subunit MlaD